MPSSQDGPAVTCSRCGVRVDLSGPLAAEGWQSVHACQTLTIEAMALKPGERPWAWRAVKVAGQSAT